MGLDLYYYWYLPPSLVSLSGQAGTLARGWDKNTFTSLVEASKWTTCVERCDKQYYIEARLSV